MQKNNIGKLLYSLRIKAGVSQKELSRGLLSVTELSRIERGEKIARKLLLEALFQRLGKSVDKLEVAVTIDEYKIILFRTLMRNCLVKRDKENAKVLFNSYPHLPHTEKPLHKQYLLKIQAAYYYLFHEDLSNCIIKLKEALSVTLPDFNQAYSCDFFKKHPLCIQELQLLLMLEYFKDNEREREKITKLESLKNYIDTYYTDKEEKAKIYPQCIYILGKALLTQNRKELAYNVCEKGIECLLQNGDLTLLDELLCMELECLDKKKCLKKPEKLSAQRDVLHFLYQLTGYEIPSEFIVCFFCINQQCELLLSNELLRELRLNSNLSQAELSENICTPETLSRIECGKSNPTYKNLKKLFQKLSMISDKYNGYIVTDNYELLKKSWDFERNLFQGKLEKAKKLLTKIEGNLDLTLPLNQQFIQSAKICVEAKTKDFSPDFIIVKLKEALCLTMKDFNGNVYRTPSRNECMILNQIAFYLEKAGQNEAADILYTKILDRYNASKVLDIYHVMSLLPTYFNYAALLVEKKEFQKSEFIGRKGLDLAIRCGKGDLLGMLTFNLSYAYEKKLSSPDNKEMQALFLKSSYYLLKMYGNEQNAQNIRNIYQTKFNIVLD